MNALVALLGFVAWTLLLVTLVFLYRGLRVLSGMPINSWPRGNKPTSDAGFVKRAEDAHANCLENLPIFAVIVLAAYASGKVAAISAIAPCVLYARIAQSCCHLIATNKPLVFLRAGFWLAQMLLFFLMLARLLT
jgi:uncharacterized MAPEG superfamily protein